MIRLALAIVFLVCAPADRANADPPGEFNIVWITVEDMSPWVGCYGDDTVPTPNIDRLAREGTRYTHAYATTPVCAPARSTLITGMYPTAIGSMHMRTGNPSGKALERNPAAYDDIPTYEATPPPAVRCFPEYLRSEGWYCTNNRKEDYQFKPPPTVWDDSSNTAHWRHRGADQRFFAVFNFTVTHESGTFATKKPSPVVTDPADVPIPSYYPDAPQVRRDIARTYDNIAAVDQRVGQVIEELETAGLLESTIVIFFSDHGVGLPRGKRHVYASGTHVPLIVRHPGIEPGVDERVISFVDLAPTTLALAGLDLPAYLPGHVFVGPHADAPVRYAYCHSDRMDAETDRSRAVTDGRYRYIRHFMPNRPHLYPVAYAQSVPMMADITTLRESSDAGPALWQMVSTSKPPEELYDTTADPHEIRNLIDDPDHGAKRDELRAALEAWMECTGDLGLLPEAEMVRTRLWPPDGAQPATGTPVAQLDATRRLIVECATEGASIGYRCGDGPWLVYTEPVVIPAGRTRVVAHRIGFKRSPVVEVE